MSITIKKIEVDKLYGLFDKKITFKEGINLLVGINGSGKTSILNLIDWLLKPSLKYLCTTRFKRVHLEFLVNFEKHEISCTQYSDKLVYEQKALENLILLLSRYMFHPKKSAGMQYYVNRS